MRTTLEERQKIWKLLDEASGRTFEIDELLLAELRFVQPERKELGYITGFYVDILLSMKKTDTILHLHSFCVQYDDFVSVENLVRRACKETYDKLVPFMGRIANGAVTGML